MEKNRTIIASTIIAIGIAILGFFIYSGINVLANKGRKVTVKGLSEIEVPADKVTWPIVCTEAGNNLSELYKRANKNTEIIKEFLHKGGVKEAEISINAPLVVDSGTSIYASEKRQYRYVITSIVTVTSRNVDNIRNLMLKEGDLLAKGIVIKHDEYDYRVNFEYTAFTDGKQEMMTEAIQNAEKTALQFAKNSHSKLDKILNANQGQFSIQDKDRHTPYIKRIRVVTTITYSLKN